MMKLNKRFTAVLLAITLFITTAYSVSAESNSTLSDTALADNIVASKLGDYNTYLSNYSNINNNKEYNLTVEDIVESGNETNIKDNSIIIPEGQYATWKINVESEILSAILVNYSAAKTAGGNLEFDIKIDNKIPFDEASVISFPRTYTQKILENKDGGNDSQPEVTEQLVWKEQTVYDTSGYIEEPLQFYFEKGTHYLTITGSRGNIAIRNIKLYSYEKPISYSEYVKKNESASNDNNGIKPIVIEAENLSEKSDVTILSKTDRSSAATYPQSPSVLKLNTLGGSSWKGIGQTVSWTFDIEKDGFYEISTRHLQNVKDGIFTCRKLLIDGNLPFAEASSIRFNYDNDWQTEKLGSNGKAFSFYLKKGEHTITFEVVAGDVADIVSTVSNSLTDLNRIYRKIILVTGNNPDINRDYHFKEIIPEEIEELKQIRKELQASVDNINKQAGANGSFTSIIQKLIFQIDKMTDNPRTIAKYLTNFKSNLGSLGEWLLNATEQPLQLDRIFICPKGTEAPTIKDGFFKNLWFAIQSFLFSYTTDYSSVGKSNTDSNSENITVWIQTGRDQGEVIRSLIDTSFSKHYNTSVTLRVVSTGLLQSVLSGNAPDVVFDCVETLPINYALRNAVVDLTEFEDCDEVMSRFSDASLRPASFNGAIYAMPQTFDFFMMFYRTDLFEEYGFKLPATWKELCELIPALQRNGMEVGIPKTINMYSTMLYQNGGELYIDDGKKTNLSSNLAIRSFADFTEFFTLYDTSVTYNFANRFRSGEMPIAIAPLSEYNQLTAFAPEINGMWKMIPIPGTMKPDGKIDNTSVGTSTYIVMMKNCKSKERTWEFMKWFMSEETQSKYAIQMESILGSCAKVPTANVNAFKQMTWRNYEYTELLKQLEFTDAVPQVPGGYYLSRTVDFAFNRVYNNDENPAEVLTDYVKELNEEIARKREEFGLGGE